VHRDTGFIVAIKAISLSRSEQDVIKKEVDILKKCRHVNIVQYYGSCYNDESLWVRSPCFFFFFVFSFVNASTFTRFLCLTRAHADSDGLLRSWFGDRSRSSDQTHAQRGRNQRPDGPGPEGIINMTSAAMLHVLCCSVLNRCSVWALTLS
jgi:serine/threonine protein kinase